MKQDLLNLSKFFSVEKPPSNKEEIKPYFDPGENDPTLVFESRFECGNLWMAVKVSDNEYNLVLQNDINTKGHTQWFYFRVNNTSQDLQVKFNVINLSKPGSLFNSGMKVLINSSKSEAGWFRGGESVSYYANGIKKGKKGKSYYTMTYTYTFTHSGDTVYFAYSHPYTFTDLMKYLQELDESDEKRVFIKRRLLTLSIAGNRCDYLTITSPGDPESIKQRKGVVISARVHPGETVGSWMMHGVLEFLTSQSPEAQVLRDNFVFKIIPMLNPDGVINGNYRCNLAGVDLNRQWKDPQKLLHPTIFAAKKLIKAFSREREVRLICDLHGHSRRKNIFIYGCNDPDNPELTREFPYLLSKFSHYFSFKSSSFRMQKSKESTLRISIYKETQVYNTFTLESSFCGCDFGPTAGLHLTTLDLKNMGRELCYNLIIDNGLKVPNIIGVDKQSLVTELKENKELIQDNEAESDSGSDSDPSEDNLDEVEYARLIIPPPKRRISSDVKTKKKNSLKKERASMQIPSKRFKNKERTMKLIQKCVNCGDIKELDHVCIKKNILNSTLASPNKFPIMKVKPKELNKGRTTLGSLSQSTSVFPTYVNHEGKKVRDQATQTTANVSPKKEINGVYFLSPNDSSTIVSTNSSYRKSDLLENLVDIEKLKNIFKHDKNVLPSINPVKIANNEKFTKTF